MFGVLVFPLLFLVLGIMCCWILIGIKGWWQAKFWLINLTFLFFVILYFSVSSFMGWPTSEGLPARMRLMGFVPNEPDCLYVLGESEDKQSGIASFFGYKSPDNLRLYKFPYNKQMHSELESAMERVNSGNYVIMSKERVLDAEEIKGFKKSVDDLRDMLGNTLFDPTYNLYIIPLNKIIKKPNS